MNEFLTTVANVNDVINNFVWVKIGLILLLGTGIIMTCLTGFFRFFISGIGGKIQSGNCLTRIVIQRINPISIIFPSFSRYVQHLRLQLE